MLELAELLEDPEFAWHFELWKEIGLSGAAAFAASKLVCDDDDFVGATITAFIFAMFLAPLARTVAIVLWLETSPETYDMLFAEAGMLNFLVGGLVSGIIGVAFERTVFAAIGAVVWNAIGPMIVVGLSNMSIGNPLSGRAQEAESQDRIGRFIK